MRFLPLSLTLLPLGSSLAPLSSADVLEVEIAHSEHWEDGRAFGTAGAYVLLEGRIHFGFDPAAPENAAIVDLDRAPLGAERVRHAGLVPADADLVVLQPIDPEKRSGTALVEVSNRGGRAAMRYFGRRADGTDDALLLRRGLTLIWVGWQFDVPPEDGRLRLRLPRIGTEDAPLTGLVRCDWVVDEPVERLELGHRAHVPYDVAAEDHPDHVLTARAGREAPREVVPRARWRFVRDLHWREGLDHLGPRWIELEGGFEAGLVYELVYRAKDPAPVGLGLAVIRDTILFAKHDERCPFPVERGVAVGISQTGRFLRHFLYQGFNTGAEGEKAYDGILAHSAGAGRGSFNHRFAQPSRDAHRYSAFFYPTDIFPFSGRVQRDPETGERDGLLARHLADGNLPRIFYTNTGYEYWGRAASLLHTSLDGAADVEMLSAERLYHLAGTQHFPVPFPPRGEPPIGSEDEDGRVWRGDPADILASLRALLVALLDWVERDAPPPPSAYPRIDDGTLVAVEDHAFPKIPGMPPPDVAHVAYRADYGPRFRSEGIVTVQPPVLGAHFPVLVPQVDELGNELGGLRGFELEAPLATYAPWFLRADGELDDFYGGFAPLAREASDASAASSASSPGEDDARPSVGELYATREAYLERVDAALAARVEGRTLLADDVPGLRARAEELWEWVAR